jgi:hypothetical protein
LKRGPRPADSHPELRGWCSHHSPDRAPCNQPPGATPRVGSIALREHRSNEPSSSTCPTDQPCVLGSSWRRGHLRDSRSARPRNGGVVRNRPQRGGSTRAGHRPKPPSVQAPKRLVILGAMGSDDCPDLDPDAPDHDSCRLGPVAAPRLGRACVCRCGRLAGFRASGSSCCFAIAFTISGDDRRTARSDPTLMRAAHSRPTLLASCCPRAARRTSRASSGCRVSIPGIRTVRPARALRHSPLRDRAA